MATITTGGGGQGVVTLPSTSTTILTGYISHGKPCSFQIVLTSGLSSESVNIVGVKSTDIVLLTPLNSQAAAMTQAYAVAVSGGVQIKSGGTSTGLESFAVLIVPQPWNMANGY